jgi:hypothetical protein
MADENSYTKPNSAHGKIYEVVKASTKDFKGIIGQGKEMKFGTKSNVFTTKDPKLAKEISDKYGYASGGSRDVVVVERDDFGSLGGRNLHTVPAMPWHEEE